jgi:hypothetical protein
MLKRHGVSRWVLVGVVSLWIGGIVFAQTGSISGVVRDER